MDKKWKIWGWVGGAGMSLWPLGVGNGGDVTAIGRLFAGCCYRQLEEMGGQYKSNLKNVHYSNPHRRNHFPIS